MKLIHCADVHLDSPMERLSTDKAQKRKQEIRSTFGRLADYAEENGVSAVLIAGDLFDEKRVTVKSRQFVLSTVRNHPAIEFFYLAGNHDNASRAFEEEDLPENLRLFGEGWTSYRIGDVVLTGSENPDPATLNLQESDVNLLILHGQVELSRTRKESAGILSLPKYKNKFVDYLALGHYHSYKKEEIGDGRGVYCYCGALEGRGFDECGEKGFVLVSVEERAVSTEFHPFSSRTVEEISCDVSGVGSQDDLTRRAGEALASVSRNSIVRLKLTGSVTADERQFLSLADLQSALGMDFFYFEAVDKTDTVVHPEEYAHSVSLKGEFFNLVWNREDLSDEEKKRIIDLGFRALSGRDLEL